MKLMTVLSPKSTGCPLMNAHHHSTKVVNKAPKLTHIACRCANSRARGGANTAAETKLGDQARRCCIMSVQACFMVSCCSPPSPPNSDMTPTSSPTSELHPAESARPNHSDKPAWRAMMSSMVFLNSALNVSEPLANTII